MLFRSSDFICISFFSSFVCATDALREAGGVGVIFAETVEPLREVGGVVEGSSWTADEIKLDAELRKEDPKPRTFPETAEAAA